MFLRAKCRSKNSSVYCCAGVETRWGRWKLLLLGSLPLGSFIILSVDNDLSAEAEMCNYQDNYLRIHSFEVFCITQTSDLVEYDLLKSLLGELEPRDRSSTVKDWATGGQAS